MLYLVKKPNTTYVLIGGRYIGDGAHGCAFNPDIKNMDESRVSKILHIKDFQNEVDILQKVQTIDPDGIFHSLYIDSFPLKTVLHNLPPDYKKCFLHGYSDINDIMVINVNYVGDISLEDFILNEFPTLSRTKKALFFTRLSNILRGLHFMSKNKLYHSDLNTGNIIIDTTNIKNNINSIKLIDFGNGTHGKPSLIGEDFPELFTNIGLKFEDLDTEEEDREESKTLSSQLYNITKSSTSIEFIHNYLQFLENEYGHKYTRIAYNDYFIDIIPK